MKVRNNQPPVILSGAKDLRGFLCYDDLRTTAEILRSAQDDISNSFTASNPFRAAGEGGWFTFVFSRWQEAALSGQGPFIDKCFRCYEGELLEPGHSVFRTQNVTDVQLFRSI